MSYCCCPLGPLFLCSVCLNIFACADWFVLIFPSVCFLQGARDLLAFGGCFTDPELSRLASSLPLRCLGPKRIPLLSAILELLKSLESGPLVIRKSVFFRQIFCMSLLI